MEKAACEFWRGNAVQGFFGAFHCFCLLFLVLSRTVLK